MRRFAKHQLVARILFMKSWHEPGRGDKPVSFYWREMLILANENIRAKFTKLNHHSRWNGANCTRKNACVLGAGASQNGTRIVLCAPRLARHQRLRCAAVAESSTQQAKSRGTGVRCVTRAAQQQNSHRIFGKNLVKLRREYLSSCWFRFGIYSKIWAERHFLPFDLSQVTR